MSLAQDAERATPRNWASGREPVAPRAALFGVSVALVTPFGPNGAVEPARAGAHGARLIDAGADGVTLFGTTGEGASIGPTEREGVLGAVLAAGVAPERVTVCLCATSVDGAQAQARAALDQGVRRLLLTPPFYFKGVSDDGLLAWIAALLERIGGAGPELILYHIPQVTQVPLSPALIRRLKHAYGDAIFGVKDSAGDWEGTRALLPQEDLAVLVGDERLLARAAPLGGAGAISGLANLAPELLSRVVLGAIEEPELNALVEEIVRHPVTPLVKALVGEATGESGWARVRPPLDPADPAVVRALAPRAMALLA